MELSLIETTCTFSGGQMTCIASLSLTALMFLLLLSMCIAKGCSHCTSRGSHTDTPTTSPAHRDEATVAIATNSEGTVQLKENSTYENVMPQSCQILPMQAMASPHQTISEGASRTSYSEAGTIETKENCAYGAIANRSLICTLTTAAASQDEAEPAQTDQYIKMTGITVRKAADQNGDSKQCSNAEPWLAESIWKLMHTEMQNWFAVHTCMYCIVVNSSISKSMLLFWLHTKLMQVALCMIYYTTWPYMYSSYIYLPCNIVLLTWALSLYM